MRKVVSVAHGLVGFDIAGYFDNRAVVFLKSHANNPLVESFYEQRAKSAGMNIMEKYVFTAEECAQRIDKHYSVFATRGAALESIAALEVTPEMELGFYEKFGQKWSESKVMTAPQAMREMNLSAEELADKFGSGKIGVPVTGQIISKVEHNGKPVYIINGFYPKMREKFTKGNGITVYSMKFANDKLTHKQFRKEFMGATKPWDAANGSLRKELFDNYQAYGMDVQPDGMDNGFHGSAGPLEAAIELGVWFGVELSDVPFIKELLDAGVTEEQVMWLTTNPDIVTLEGKQECVFDYIEEITPQEALDKLLAIRDQFPQ